MAGVGNYIPTSRLGSDIVTASVVTTLLARRQSGCDDYL